MKKILVLLTFSVSAFAFFSCEDDITLDLPEYEQKLAVYCVLQPDSLPKLFLNRSKSYFDYSDTSGDFYFIKDALVTITEAGSGFIDTLKVTFGPYYPEGSYGPAAAFGFYYTGKNKPKQNERYILNVWHGSRHLSGETFIYNTAAIKQATLELDTSNFGSEFIITTKFDDRASESNAYRASVFYWQHNNFPGAPEWELIKVSESEFENDQFTNGHEMQLQNFAGFGIDPTSDSTFVYIKLENFTRPTANYIESVIQQSWTGSDPFTEPVTIKNNVNGGLGVFGSSAPAPLYKLNL